MDKVKEVRQLWWSLSGIYVELFTVRMCECMRVYIGVFVATAAQSSRQGVAGRISM